MISPDVAPAIAPPPGIGAHDDAAGWRSTRRRRVLLDVIGGSDRPLDIEEIVEQARRREPRLSRSTVYRFLALLRRSGAAR